MNDSQNIWTKTIAKAWADEDFKQRLLKDPAAVMSAEGMDIPEGMAFKCVEATNKLTWLVIPPPPTDDEIEEGEERLAALMFG